MKFNIRVDIQVNKIVKYFILVDLVLLAGWGLIEPIFSVFVLKQVAGATLMTIGTSAAIYWILKSVLQIPLANMLDRIKGEKDDLYALTIGLLVAGITAFSFTLVREPWQLYLVQIFHALGLALYVASWPGLFSRHLDKDRVSFDWALDSTAAGISAGVAAFLGGIIANRFGFQVVFILAAVASFLAAMVVLWVPQVVIPGVTNEAPVRKDHTPTDTI